MEAEVLIRPAGPDDAEVAARLMYDSGPETALAMLGPREEQAVETLEFLFRGKRHQFSHEHAFVAELGDRVVGLALGMSGYAWQEIGAATGRELAGRLRRKLGLLRFWRLLRTTFTLGRHFPPPRRDDYFVQMIAVLPEARRKGVGRSLMECMEHQARRAGARRLALDALVENVDARAFYRELGFQEELVVTKRALKRRFGIQGRIRLAKSLD